MAFCHFRVQSASSFRFSDRQLFLVALEVLCLGLKFPEIITESIKTLFPEFAILLDPIAGAIQAPRHEAGRAQLPWRLRSIRPARWSTLRCFEIAGRVMSNGLANSVTDVSPCFNRARIAQQSAIGQRRERAAELIGDHRNKPTG